MVRQIQDSESDRHFAGIPKINLVKIALALTLSLLSASGQSCDSGLNLPGFNKATLSVQPDTQDIADDEDTILIAETANLPEPSTDSDGIHGPAMIRWKITSGGGGLRAVSVTQTAGDKAAEVVTDPSAEYGNVVQYVPDLDQSGEVKIHIDVFRPTDRTEIDQFGAPQTQHEDIVVAEDEAIIHVNDKRRLAITPKATVLPAGGTVTLKAVFNAPNDDPSLPDVKDSEVTYEWNYSGLAGAGSLESSPDSDSAIFTAFNEAATFTISLKTTETLKDGKTLVSGPVYATVQINPKLNVVHTFGYYFSKDESDDPDYYSVVAWVYVPKIQGAISYTVVGQDMHDDAYWGTGHTWGFSTADSTFGGLEDEGGSYRFGLSSAGGAIASNGIGGAYAWMESRFSGMRVLVTAVVQE